MDENTSSIIGQICQLLTTKKLKVSDRRILLQKLFNGLQNRDWLDCINENSRLCSNEIDENIDLVTSPFIFQANWKRLFDSVLFILKQELNGSHDAVESFDCFKIISLNALSFVDSGLNPDAFIGHAVQFYKLKAILKHQLAALNEIIIEGIFKRPLLCADISEMRFKQVGSIAVDVLIEAADDVSLMANISNLLQNFINFSHEFLTLDYRFYFESAKNVFQDVCNRSSDIRVQINLVKSMNSLIRIYASENPQFFIHHSNAIVSNILNSMREWMNHAVITEFFNYQFILHHPRNSNMSALSPDWKNFVQELYRQFYILLVYKAVDVSTMANRANANALMELSSRVFLQIFALDEEISVQNCSQFNSTLMRRMTAEGDQETKRRCLEIGFVTILDRISQKLNSSSVINLLKLLSAMLGKFSASIDTSDCLLIMSNVVDYLGKAKKFDVMQILIDMATRLLIRLRNIVDSSLEAVFAQLYNICIRFANVKSIQDQISYLLSHILPLVTLFGYRKVQSDICHLLHYCFLRPTSNVLRLLINFFSFFEFDDDLSSLNSIRLPESQNCKFRPFLVDWIFNFSLNNDENSLNFLKDVSPTLFCQFLEQISLRKPCNMRTFDDVHEIPSDRDQLETDLCHQLGIIDKDGESVSEINAVDDYDREKKVESIILSNFQKFYNEYFNNDQVTQSEILPCFCAITFFLANRRKVDQENVSQTVDWLKLVSSAKSAAATYVVLLNIKCILKSIVSNWKISNSVIEFVHNIASYSESPICNIFVSEENKKGSSNHDYVIMVRRTAIEILALTCVRDPDQEIGALSLLLDALNSYLDEDSDLHVDYGIFIEIVDNVCEILSCLHSSSKLKNEILMFIKLLLDRCYKCQPLCTTILKICSRLALTGCFEYDSNAREKLLNILGGFWKTKDRVTYSTSVYGQLVIILTNVFKPDMIILEEKSSYAVSASEFLHFIIQSCSCYEVMRHVCPRAHPVFNSKTDFCRILESFWKAVEKEDRSQILLISLIDMLINQMEMFPSFHSICIWELYKVYASYPELGDIVFRKLKLRFNIDRLKTILNTNLLSSVKFLQTNFVNSGFKVSFWLKIQSMDDFIRDNYYTLWLICSTTKTDVEDLRAQICSKMGHSPEDCTLMCSPLVFVDTFVDNGLSFEATGFKVSFPCPKDVKKLILKNLAAIVFYLIDRIVFEHAWKSAGEIDDHFFKTAIVLLLEEIKRTNMNEFFIDYPWEFGLRLFVNFRQRILCHEYLPITLRRFVFVLLNFFDQNQLKVYLPFIVDQVFLASNSFLKYIASKKLYDLKTIDYCLNSVVEFLSKFASDSYGVERFLDQNCDYHSKLTFLREIIANRSRHQWSRVSETLTEGDEDQMINLYSTLPLNHMDIYVNSLDHYAPKFSSLRDFTSCVINRLLEKNMRPFQKLPRIASLYHQSPFDALLHALNAEFETDDSIRFTTAERCLKQLLNSETRGDEDITLDQWKSFGMIPRIYIEQRSTIDFCGATPFIINKFLSNILRNFRDSKFDVLFEISLQMLPISNDFARRMFPWIINDLIDGCHESKRSLIISKLNRLMEIATPGSPTKTDFQCLSVFIYKLLSNDPNYVQIVDAVCDLYHRRQKKCLGSDAFKNAQINFLQLAKLCSYLNYNFNAVFFLSVHLEQIRSKEVNRKLYVECEIKNIINYEKADDSIKQILSKSFLDLNSLDAINALDDMQMAQPEVRARLLQSENDWNKLSIMKTDDNKGILPIVNGAFFALGLANSMCSDTEPGNLDHYASSAWRLGDWNLLEVSKRESQTFNKFVFDAIAENTVISETDKMVGWKLALLSHEKSSSIANLSNFILFSEICNVLQEKPCDKFMIQHQTDVDDDVLPLRWSLIHRKLTTPTLNCNNNNRQFLERDFCRLTLDRLYYCAMKNMPAVAFKIVEKFESVMLQSKSVQSNVLRGSVTLKEAEILWHSGEKSLAIWKLKSLKQSLEYNRLTPPNEETVLLLARCAVTLGKFESMSGSQDKALSYFEKATSSLEKIKRYGDSQDFDTQTLKTLSDAYACMAICTDRQYQSLTDYIESPTFDTKKSLLDSLKRIGSSLKAEKVTDISIKLAQRKQNLDEKEVQELLNTQNRLLNVTLSSYMRAFALCDEYDLKIFRMISLWFNAPVTLPVSEDFSLLIESIPTRKFILVWNQLTSRLDGSLIDKSTEIIKKLVLKTVMDHPYHTFYTLLSLANSISTNSGQNDKLKTIRCVTAKRILKELKNFPSNQVFNNLEEMAKCYVEVGSIDSKNVQNDPKKWIFSSKTKLINFDKKVPAITTDIEVDPTCKYENVIWITNFEKSFTIASGKSLPIVVKCLCSDGKTRKQIVKGHDDTRQDSIMQQVFRIVNVLLARGKNLKNNFKSSMRPYNVIPLTPDCGVIEWCENSISFGEYLVGPDVKHGCHKRLFPDDWNGLECRKAVLEASRKPLEERYAAFLDVCDHIRPVFRHFFYEYFDDSVLWYEAIEKYSHSVAISSIVGHVLGLSDRHTQNILLDVNTGEVIHIDLGMAFEQGRLLPTPEQVPFRLTRDIVDGFGICGTEGLFRKTCERVMKILRDSKDVLLPIVSVLLHDPVAHWSLSHSKLNRLQPEALLLSKQGAHETNVHAERAVLQIKEKLMGLEKNSVLSVEGQVSHLIQQSMDPINLCQMYFGWQAFL